MGCWGWQWVPIYVLSIYRVGLLIKRPVNVLEAFTGRFVIGCSVFSEFDDLNGFEN